MTKNIIHSKQFLNILLICYKYTTEDKQSIGNLSSALQNHSSELLQVSITYRYIVGLVSGWVGLWVVGLTDGWEYKGLAREWEIIGNVGRMPFSLNALVGIYK